MTKWTIPIEVLLAMNCMYIEREKEDNMQLSKKWELIAEADRMPEYKQTIADLLEALMTVSEDWRSELHWETRELIHEAIEKAT